MNVLLERSQSFYSHISQESLFTTNDVPFVRHYGLGFTVYGQCCAAVLTSSFPCKEISVACWTYVGSSTIDLGRLPLGFASHVMTPLYCAALRAASLASALRCISVEVASAPPLLS